MMQLGDMEKRNSKSEKIEIAPQLEYALFRTVRAAA
jgi:hypothetical protein